MKSKRVARSEREVSGRAGGGRPLSDNPDQSIKANVTTCQGCGEEITESEQQLMAQHDKIGLLWSDNKVRHPRRSRWLNECDRPKGGCPRQGLLGQS
jgi:hypothetical protein